MYIKYIKRIIDLLVAGFVFLLLSPLLLVVIVLQFLFNNNQVFFVQVRPGKDEKLFNLLKFKTMNDKRDLQGNLLMDNERMTRLGHFIRKTSIDEIPQLINVLRGEMSLIGPRPLLVEYLSLYNDEQRKRHQVRPGITGWAQVNGRNTISWNEKFKLDIWYVENVSFLIDCKILFRTIIKVFNSSGISSDTSVTMEKFTGN
jgi:undecaprenyl phosphate N,N'-diacetylbacillosamine 1-phosphate transferase